MDLLPSPGLGTEWTKSLPTDEGHESDPMFEFDGSSTAVVVPDGLGLGTHNPGENFTVATWMKHAAHPDLDRHTKEHILCNADDHSESRRSLSLCLFYYSRELFDFWFLRGGRLLLQRLDTGW
jgi:hypothetical protein